MPCPISRKPRILIPSLFIVSYYLQLQSITILQYCIICLLYILRRPTTNHYQICIHTVASSSSLDPVWSSSSGAVSASWTSDHQYPLLSRLMWSPFISLCFQYLMSKNCYAYWLPVRDMISSQLVNRDSCLGQGQLWWCTWQCNMIWFKNVLIEIRSTSQYAIYRRQVRCCITNAWGAVSIMRSCDTFSVTVIFLGSYWITR